MKKKERKEKSHVQSLASLDHFIRLDENKTKKTKQTKQNKTKQNKTKRKKEK